MTLIAYDIDGVLTTPEGKTDFNVMRKSENTVGIVTARSETSAQTFVDEEGLNPDFIVSTSVKFRALMELEEEHEATSPVYVGSGFRDKMAAKVAGWTYRQL